MVDIDSLKREVAEVSSEIEGADYLLFAMGLRLRTLGPSGPLSTEA